MRPKRKNCAHTNTFVGRFKNVHFDRSYEPMPKSEKASKEYVASWPYRGEPSSDNAVPTAAKYYVRELR
jgi:hypothetical protein